MEDLDAGRANQQHVDQSLRDLEWLGLDWDGPMLRQSERLEPIREVAYSLHRSGLAYACCCSRSDVRQALAAPHAGEDEPVYPGTCRGRFADLRQAERQCGAPVGLRFAVDSREFRFHDSIHGECRHRLDANPGDFLILRRDRTPAYQLSVVVDDAFQGVTDVVRGADLLDSTARQIALLRALNLPEPSYHHVPLIVDTEGRRLAKRDNSRSLTALRDAGIDPRQVISWVARNCGLQVPSRVGANEVVSSFTLANVTPSPIECRIDDWYR